MQKIIEEIREYVHSQWMLGELHGIRHWDRVYANGQRLLTPDANPLVVGLFAYLHDSCRMDDGMDLYHGERAAVWIRRLQEIQTIRLQFVIERFPESKRSPSYKYRTNWITFYK